MNTATLAAAVTGFLLGGLTVSVAAELEDHPATQQPSHSSSTSQVEVDHRPSGTPDRP